MKDTNFSVPTNLLTYGQVEFNCILRITCRLLSASPSQSIEQFPLFKQRWEESIINSMIALLLLQCILEILVSKIQSGGMVILLICWVCETHKHLGLLLCKRLADHVEEMILRASKGIGLITRLRRYLPRNSLTIYRAFIRPHLDYEGVVYDHPGNASFIRKLETVQYNASLAVTGCFRGTSRDKLYSEFSLESLANRRFYRRLIAFYRIALTKRLPDI